MPSPKVKAKYYAMALLKMLINALTVNALLNTHGETQSMVISALQDNFERKVLKVGGWGSFLEDAGRAQVGYQQWHGKW